MSYRKPRNIDEVLSGQLQSELIEAGIDTPAGWTVYVTDSSCGRARSSIKTCTVPKWALTKNFDGKRDIDFRLYYAAHELAHAWDCELNGKMDNRGPKFYKQFRQLCPPHLWHHELHYKKRNAKAAGISPDPKVNILAANAAGMDAPASIAAGPTEPDELRAEAIRRDPRIAKKLKDVADHDLRSYVRGWFQM